MTLPEAAASAPRSRRSDPLLAPLKIRHLTLRNRIMSTSHACGHADNGMPTERYQLYHAVASRNVHAAVLDSMRLCRAL